MIEKRNVIVINVACTFLVVISIIFILSRMSLLENSSFFNKHKEFSFNVSTNSFGDRIFVETPVKITYLTQRNSPDIVSISSYSGEYSGSFVWTIIPNQGGVRRVLGEYEVDGHVYKVCEFLYNMNKQATGTAERYFVINNNGPKYRNPEKIDPTAFSDLFNVAQPEQALVQGSQAGPNTEGLPATPELARRASALISTCTGYRGTPT